MKVLKEYTRLLNEFFKINLSMALHLQTSLDRKTELFYLKIPLNLKSLDLIAYKIYLNKYYKL